MIINHNSEIKLFLPYNSERFYYHDERGTIEVDLDAEDWEPELPEPHTNGIYPIISPFSGGWQTVTYQSTEFIFNTRKRIILYLYHHGSGWVSLVDRIDATSSLGQTEIAIIYHSNRVVPGEAYKDSEIEEFSQS